MAFHSLFRRANSSPAHDEPPRVAQLVHSLPPVALNLTLGKALHALRMQHVPWLPVLEGVKLAGCVTESAVAERVSFAPDAGDTEIIIGLVEPPPAVLDPGLSLPDANTIFADTGASMLPVVSWDNRYLGCVTRMELAAALAGRLYPPRVGGMATPLGVYLVAGSVRGGVGDGALMLTGMAMALMLFVAQALLATVFAVITHYSHSWFVRGLYDLLMDHDVAFGTVVSLQLYLVVTLALIFAFLLAMRFAPLLTGYHAGEHQTVNAMEAGEALTPENVARMPRVHPRCGTNLVALVYLSLIGLILITTWLVSHPSINDMDTGLLLLIFSTVFILLTWRKVGGWLQQHFTTRRATRREIESGIRAGLDVNRQYQMAPLRPAPRWPQRIWNMGLPQVAVGLILIWFVLSPAKGLLDSLLASLLK